MHEVSPADPESAPDNPPSELPQVPGYEVLGVLGKGDMGVVYKARHLSLKRRRDAALEILKPLSPMHPLPRP